jgi:hypothetical protein
LAEVVGRSSLIISARAHQIVASPSIAHSANEIPNSATNAIMAVDVNPAGGKVADIAVLIERLWITQISVWDGNRR